MMFCKAALLLAVCLVAADGAFVFLALTTRNGACTLQETRPFCRQTNVLSCRTVARTAPIFRKRHRAHVPGRAETVPGHTDFQK